MVIELKICPHCGTKGILIMSDGRCPNCKRMLRPVPETPVEDKIVTPFNADSEQSQKIDDEHQPTEQINVPSEQTQAKAASVDPKLCGIGGWLIFPAIGLVLTPILSVLGLIASLALFSQVADAGYGGIYTLEIFVQVGLLIFVLYAAGRFFGKRANAPSTMITLFITIIVTHLVLLIIEVNAEAEAFAIESVKALARGTIGACIWIPYFRISRRVKATFVN
jgi:hypothetical protein